MFDTNRDKGMRISFKDPRYTELFLLEKKIKVFVSDNTHFRNLRPSLNNLTLMCYITCPGLYNLSGNCSRFVVSSLKHT